jgi:cytoskeletal protein CcmA (bactofilin family)
MKKKKTVMDRDGKKRKSGVSRLDSMPITTVVGNGIVFKGDIHGDGIVRIDGRVEGSVSSKQGIILGEKAEVKGRLESDNIIIFGHISGIIKSKELILKTTGSIHGDVVSEFLEVEIGGKYDGNLKIGQCEANDNDKQDKPKGKDAERANA